MTRRTWNKKYKRKKSSSEILDEKIKLLDLEMRKTKLGESIANSTSGLYTVTGFEPGDPAIPEIPAVPAVPPTYEDVTGGLSNPNDFSWPDQGDGSDPDFSATIPDNFYTTYNDEQVPALRAIDTYNGELVDYGDHPSLGGLAFRGGWLGWNYLAYPSGSGIRGVGTTRFPGEGVGQAIYSAYSNWPYEGKVVKTVYQWQQLDCLFGSCQGASQYYPSDRSATSTPKADRALYAWTIWLPADADGNLLPNRIQTDPGSPEIPAVPGVPEGPPKPVVLSRYGLGDPNYYPGDPSNFLMGLLNLGKRGYDYIIRAISQADQNTQIAGYGLRPDGTSGMNKVGDKVYDPNTKKQYELVPSPKYGGGTEWQPVRQASNSSQDTQIAADYTNQGGQKVLGPHTDVKYDKHMKMFVPASPRPGALPQRINAHYEPEGQVIAEGWQSPKHTNIEKDQRERWFNPKDIASEYPKEPPAPMIDGYSSKSLLAPKPIDREPVIKITKKDLDRNHKFTDAEIEDLMDTINRINAFLSAHPEELIHAQKRYPKHDPRLAELNWKMDQMLSASDEYIETHFPENQKLLKKVQQAVKRSIKLTDPKTYKDVKDPQTVYKLLSVDYVNEYLTQSAKKKIKLKNRNKKTAARFLKKPRIKSAMELLDTKIIELNKELKKTGMDG